MGSERTEPELNVTNDSWTLNTKVDNALLLASVPVIGYVLTTAFIVGRYGYFGVPFDLLSISFTDNLYAIIAVSVVLVFVVLVFGFAFQRFMNSRRTFWVSLEDVEHSSSEISAEDRSPTYAIDPFFAAAIIVAAGAIWYSLAFNFASLDLNVFPGSEGQERSFESNLFFYSLFFAILMIPLLLLSNRLASWSQKELSRQSASFLRLVAVALIFVGLFSLSFTLGRFSAWAQDGFYILDGNPEMAVLYMTNERLVATAFDRTTNRASSALSVIYLQDLGDRTLRFEEIGQLIPNWRDSWIQPAPFPTPMPTLTPIPSSATPTQP